MINNPLMSIMAGFLLWSVVFVVLYGVQATGCHLAEDKVSALGDWPGLRATLTALFLVSFAAVVLFYFLARRRHRRPDTGTEAFRREVAMHVWLAAAIATPFCFGGVVWLSLCGT
ncbi:hypothetical protein [Sinorhizobium alkalisoli]|uniref:Uncharacterized protein n=1 Tax=Sinorhizobium alkalisoli TaxID=1752398 RepID=A0A1E3VF04_9HYPH|nr:hypothetical protein [Sinorhizobium alkalisoli]MCA1491485.1 hypothetical protein [Ensifer sp. NBAIM29]MCG5480335.1 hypothetical protein [Sinorhizobium alkalisoli]ODR92114.1 hypothetical protein A8M32_06675 [Sinorhizobium alkalisoli]